MNISKFTQKSIEAVNSLEKLAYEYGNQEIEQEHLLYALLKQEDSLILKMIEKMEIDKTYFTEAVESALEKRTKVSGGQVYIGQYLNKVLVQAEDEAKAMGDRAFVPVHDQESKSGDQETVSGVRHYKRTLPAGTFHRTRQSACDDGQSGGNL